MTQNLWKSYKKNEKSSGINMVALLWKNLWEKKLQEKLKSSGIDMVVMFWHKICEEKSYMKNEKVTD